MSNRKTFLQQSALLTAGVLFFPSCMSVKSNTKIGLQLYTLRDIIGQDVSGVINKVAEIGYQNVEVYGYTSSDGFWGLTPKEFKAILKDNRLDSSSGHYGLEEFIRTGKEKELRAAIDASNILGHEYITLPHLEEDLRGSIDTYNMIADKMNKVAAICKESGLKFAYHNHDFEFADLGNGTTAYKIFLDNTDPSLVHFEPDLYWVVRSKNDPIALFTEYADRFPMWHVKDMDKLSPELNTEIGSGSIDFKFLFKNSKLSGLKHLFVEQENFSKDPYQSIRESYDYIKNELI